jgi:arginase
LDHGAFDAGVVIPARYVDDGDLASGRLRNQDGIVDFSRRLADRLDSLLKAGHAPLVLGGDCSLLVAIGLTLSRRGRYGLVHIDGHTDFRHPGNSSACLSLGGEDLAAAIGLHWPAVAAIDGHTPYFRPSDAVHVGCRDHDERLSEAKATIAAVYPASRVHQLGSAAVADAISELFANNGVLGYWIHLDVDVLDPTVMPAVDAPDADGLTVGEVQALLEDLASGATGAHVTIFDPDLDPDGTYARLVSTLVAGGFERLGSEAKEARERERGRRVQS